MFWELYQVGQIQSASQTASEAASRSRNTEHRTSSAERSIQELQGRLDSAVLACQAMWELVSEQTGLADADLLKRMQEVDLRDGKADGKITPVPVDCSKCSRPVNPRRKTCMYCGAAMVSESSPFNQ